MAFTMMPGFACLQIAYAANSPETLTAQSDVIGRLNGKGYSSFKKLVDDLEGNYANGEPTSIELNNSTIQHNYAHRNGGFYTNVRAGAG